MKPLSTCMVIISVLVSSVASATVIYNQSADLNGTPYSSVTDAQTVYDDFTLNAADLVTGVAWHGEFWNPTAHGTVTGFLIEFYTYDTATQPGSLIFSENVVGNANETLVNASRQIYKYDVEFSNPASLLASTKYLIAIQAVNPNTPQWGWLEASSGNEAAIYQTSSGYSSIPSDFAFSLESNPIPEPTTLALMGFGLAGIGYWRQRSQRAV